MMLQGLFGWHFVILLGLIGVPIAAAVLLYVRARKARASGDPTPVVNLTLVLAAFYGALCVIGAVVGFVSTLMSPSVTMTVPVSAYWPQLPGVTVTGGQTADVVAGGFTSAELTIENLSMATRVLWASGQSLGGLVPAAIAGLIALACFQLLRGAAFAPVVARAAMITAVIVLFGGLGSQILSDAAGSMASSQALTISAAEYSGYPDDFDIYTFLPQPALNISIDFWPIGAALGFAALSAVFRFGSRLQKDAELLV
jgi:hypothetical protein